MKILHISPEGTIDILGGRGIFLRKILPLIGKRHEVKLLSFDEGQGKGYEMVKICSMLAPAPTDYLGMQYATNFYMMKSMLELFKTWTPDIIHVHDADSVEAVISVKGNIPMVYTCHLSAMGTYLDGICTAPHQKYLISREQEAMREAVKVHVCSEYYASKFCPNIDDFGTIPSVNAMWYLRDKPEVIYNGVDQKDFGDVGTELDHKYKNIFFAGRFAVGKGIETLCEAVASMPDYRLVMAGQYGGNKAYEDDYPPVRAIKEFQNNFPDRIRLLGHIPHEHIGYWAKQCSIWAVPSWHAPFELVGLEAMACGVVLVCSRTGAFLEYGVPGYNCIMATPQDAKSLKEAIERAVLTAGKLIEGGFETAWENTWDKSANKLMELYDNTMATVS